MKKKIVMAGGSALLLGGAAFALVLMMGVPEKRDGPPRGTDAYYVSEKLLQDLPEITVNLKGNGGAQFLKVQASVLYVIGDEIEGGDASPRFDKHRSLLQDRLNMLLSGKSFAEVDGSDNKTLIKEEIRRIVQHVVFPEEMGRVEDVLYKEFIVQ